MEKTNHDECKHYGQNTDRCATFLARTKDRSNYKSIELVYTDTPWLYRQCDQQRMQHTHTFNGPLVRDYPGEPVPEETFTHSHPSWSSDILYQLPPSTTIHVQFTCSTVLFHNLSPGPLWSSSWTEKPAKKLTENCCAFRSITCTEQW